MYEDTNESYILSITYNFVITFSKSGSWNFHFLPYFGFPLLSSYYYTDSSFVPQFNKQEIGFHKMCPHDIARHLSSMGSP